MTDDDLETIAERTFGEYCAERGYTIVYRGPFRRWWHAAFVVGFEIGARLAKRKRRD